jgi:protein AaeX
MIAENNIGGVFFSSVLIAACLGCGAMMVLGRLLLWLGFYRFVWHRPLFDLCLFTFLWALAAKALPVLAEAMGSS